MKLARKVLLLFITLGLSILLSNVVYAVNPSASIKWKTQWNPSSTSDYAYGTCSDGQYIYVVGYTWDEGDGDTSGTSTLIAKVDPETGQVLDYIKYEPYDGSADDDSDYLYDCVIVRGYLYAIGYSQSDLDTNGFRHIVKVDLSTFTKVTEYNYDYVSGVERWYTIDTDGTYLYVVGTDILNKLWIQKLDLDGNIIASKQITIDVDIPNYCRSGASSRGNLAAYAVRYYDEHIYIVSQYNCEGDWGGDGYSDDYDYRTVVVKLNANDLSFVAYRVKDWYTQTWEGSQTEYIYGIDVDDSGVYAVGTYNDGSKYNAFLWKLDLDLNEINSTSWISYFGNYQAIATKIRIFKRYSLVAGFESDGSVNHHTFRIFDENLNNVFTVVLDNGDYSSTFPSGRMYLDDANKILYVAGYDSAAGEIEWTIYALQLKNFGSIEVSILEPSNNETKYVSLVPLKYVVTNTSVPPDYFVVNLSNPNSYDLTDYQVRIDLSDYLSSTTNLKVCADSECNTLLNFCYEQSNGECNTSPSKVIWVKVNLTANSNTTIWIKTTDTNYAKNGDEVFDFYNDFSDGVLDGTIQATKYGGSSTWTAKESNGLLVLENPSDGTNGHAIYVFDYIYTTGELIEARMQDPDTVDNSQMGIALTSSTKDIAARRVDADGISLSDNIIEFTTSGSTTLASVDVNTDTNYHVIGLAHDGSNIYMFVDGVRELTTSYTLSGTYNVGIFVAYTAGALINVDWIRVRKYADQEPTVTITPVTDTSQQFTAEIWVDGQFVRNETTNNTVEKETTVEILKEGSHTIEVKVYDPEIEDYVSDSVTISLDLYDEFATYSNYTQVDSKKFVDTLVYNVSIRCGALNHDIIIEAWNGKTYTFTCDNETKTISDKHKFESEGNYSTWFKLNAVDPSDSRYFGNETFIKVPCLYTLGLNYEKYVLSKGIYSGLFVSCIIPSDYLNDIVQNYGYVNYTYMIYHIKDYLNLTDIETHNVSLGTTTTILLNNTNYPAYSKVFYFDNLPYILANETPSLQTLLPSLDIARLLRVYVQPENVWVYVYRKSGDAFYLVDFKKSQPTLTGELHFYIPETDYLKFEFYDENGSLIYVYEDMIEGNDYKFSLGEGTITYSFTSNEKSFDIIEYAPGGFNETEMKWKFREEATGLTIYYLKGNEWYYLDYPVSGKEITLHPKDILDLTNVTRITFVFTFADGRTLWFEYELEQIPLGLEEVKQIVEENVLLQLIMLMSILFTSAIFVIKSKSEYFHVAVIVAATLILGYFGVISWKTAIAVVFAVLVASKGLIKYQV